MTFINRRGRALHMGLGLVELMIAMLLGLLLSGALIQAYIGSRTTYQLQDSMSIVQENGRFALGYLTKEVRMAGYIGCGAIDLVQVNNLSAPAADLPATFDKTQIIRAGAPADYVALGVNAVPATDVLVLRKASSVSAHLNSAMASAGSNVSLTDNAPSLAVGDYALIADCSSADLFNVSAIGVGVPVSISHAASFLKSGGYGTDAEVMALESTYYFIRDTGRTTKNNLPIYSLYMKTRAAGTGGFSNAVELVEGVENMKIQFGVDDDGDLNVDRYVSATDMTAGDWGDIVSVQINLLMQGVDDRAAASTGNFSQAIKFDGKDIAADGRLRQQFTGVTAVRNRLSQRL